ncbi:hypothetical protein KAU32_01450 [bacterium]|nr:hypothetical protein [bacterium]
MWLNDFQAYDEYSGELNRYIDYYNKERMH